MISEVMSYAPDPTIANYWSSFTEKFIEAWKGCYCTEDFTPYMHVFTTHVDYWLKEHGNIESFANYDIESKNSVNKTVVHHASDRYGGKNRAKNNIPQQQLQYEYRDNLELFIVPEPVKQNVSKRKKKRTKDNKQSNKRQRVTKSNWVTKTAAIISSPTFNRIQTEVYEENFDEILSQCNKFGQDFDIGVHKVIDELDLIQRIENITNNIINNST